MPVPNLIFDYTNWILKIHCQPGFGEDGLTLAPGFDELNLTFFYWLD